MGLVPILKLGEIEMFGFQAKHPCDTVILVDTSLLQTISADAANFNAVQ